MRTGTCYEDALRFVVRGGEGVLVHGTVYAGYPRREIRHAWVKLPTGVYEPGSDSLFSAEEFSRAFRPREEYCYSDAEAAVMSIRTGNFGPWTDAERRASSITGSCKNF